MGKEYIQYIYFAVYLKLKQYYKSIILQLKKDGWVVEQDKDTPFDSNEKMFSCKVWGSHLGTYMN